MATAKGDYAKDLGTANIMLTYNLMLTLVSLKILPALDAQAVFVKTVNDLNSSGRTAAADIIKAMFKAEIEGALAQRLSLLDDDARGKA